MLKKSINYIGILLLVALFVTLFKSMVLSIYLVSGPSMQPALHNGEFILVSMYSY
jgi:signal peptidase I